MGREITTLIKSDLSIGEHTIDFNAKKLNSGVYFYKIEIKGIDGSNYSSIKKMLLLK